MFGVQNNLDIVICDSPEEAVEKGYVYREGFQAVEIKKVVVVRKGTEAGNSTVDLILQDQQGKKYVVMLTGSLIKHIPC